MSDEKLYKTLTTNEKIQYILNRQEKGLSIKEISIEMGYSQVKNIRDFMRNKGFAIEGDRFIESLEGGICRIKDTPAEITLENKDTFAIQDKNIQVKLFDMLDKYDMFMEVLDWYEHDRGHVGGDSHIVEVITGLQINYNETKTMKTSIRIDEAVWEDFKKLGEGKYKHISNVKLISQAVYEFIEKYKG